MAETTKTTTKTTKTAKTAGKATKTAKATKPKKEKVKFIQAVGRRKTAVAQVRIYPGVKKKGVLVNDKKLNDYFPIFTHQEKVLAPLKKANLGDDFPVTVVVRGGGLTAQAEAIRHGLSQALVKVDEELRLTLKKAGYLARDPRARERKKFGLKRARRAPQWRKR